MLKPLMIAALGAFALAGSRAQADDWSRIRLSFATDWGWIDTEWGDGPDYGYRYGDDYRYRTYDRYPRYGRYREHQDYRHYGDPRYGRGDYRGYGARSDYGRWHCAPGYYRGGGYYLQGGGRSWQDDRRGRERHRDDGWRGSRRWSGDGRPQADAHWSDRGRWRRDDR